MRVITDEDLQDLLGKKIFTQKDVYGETSDRITLGGEYMRKKTRYKGVKASKR